MKPKKTIEIINGLDFTVCLHQFCNGDEKNNFFYSLDIVLHSDTGATSEMVLPLDADFEPVEIGKQLIQFKC